MTVCTRCRGGGHVLTSDPYNPSGICPECRPVEYARIRNGHKITAFGANYGMSPAKLQAKLAPLISATEAREMLEATKKRFKGLNYNFQLKSDPAIPRGTIKMEYMKYINDGEFRICDHCGDFVTTDNKCGCDAGKVTLSRPDAPWW